MRKISIIIPTYNSGKYISSAVESIINQPIFLQCELIGVNEDQVFMLKALLEELERVGGVQILKNATNKNVLGYQHKDLYLFQNNLTKFILLAKLEGYKIFFGRLALKIPFIRVWRDVKIYPYKKVDINGPIVE